MVLGMVFPCGHILLFPDLAMQGCISYKDIQQIKKYSAVFMAERIEKISEIRIKNVDKVMDTFKLNTIEEAVARLQRRQVR